jgi:hypothetical protein
MVNAFQYIDSDKKKTRNKLNQNPHAFYRGKYPKGPARFKPVGSYTIFHRARIETDADEIVKRIKKCLEHQHGLMIKILSCNCVTYSGFEYAEILIQIYYGPINKLCDIYEKTIVVAGVHPGEHDMTLRMIPCE